MSTHIEWPFDCLSPKVSSQFIVVYIIFSTADYSFGLLVLISAVRETENVIIDVFNNETNSGIFNS